MFLLAYFAGLIISFIASVPTGPVNLAIVHATLVNGKKSGLMIALGALIIEVLYCMLSVFGMHLIFSEEAFLKQLSLISIPVLIGMGLVSMFKKDFLKRNIQPRRGNEFLTGITLTVTNPMLLFFWITISAFLQSNAWMENKLLDNTFFILGVATGIFLLFYVLILITSRQNKKVTPRFKRNMNVILGWVFIGLAAFMILKTAWIYFSTGQI